MCGHDTFTYEMPIYDVMYRHAVCIRVIPYTRSATHFTRGDFKMRTTKPSPTASYITYEYVPPYVNESCVHIRIKNVTCAPPNQGILPCT